MSRTRPLRSRRARLLVALPAILALTTASGCSLLEDRGPQPTGIPSSSGAAPAGLEKFYDQKLDWSDCQGGQCAKLEVPVSWEDPGGDTIEVAVLKAPAKGKKVGSLVVNPGGPGGSGVEYAQYADYIVSPKVRRSFDVVGFDPRGVGQSAPIDCLEDNQLDGFLGMDPTPDDDAERDEVARIAKDFAAGCEEKSGALLGHVSTKDAAKDMDVLRAVLGDSKLTYLGKSYGTYLGATYAELFPDKVGRFVLDGVVAPDLTSEEITIGQAKGFDTATRAWARSCIEDGGCPLGPSEQEVVDTVLDELEKLDRKPVSGAGGLQLTEGWAMLGVARAMYDQGIWSELTDAIVALRKGNGSPLGQLALQYAERSPNGSYTGNIMEVIYAVNCLDHPEETDPDKRKELAERATKEAPIWGRFLVTGTTACAEWPVEPVNQPHTIEAKGADPILVVGTTRDPATPYEWAQRLDDQLADSRLVTHDGDGHTAYMRQNDCVDKAVDTYWLTGKMPEEGLRC